MMNILISGTGLVSTNIFDQLKGKYNFYFLTTSKKKSQAKDNHYYWDPINKVKPSMKFKNIDVIVNTSGHTINCRWTKKNKDKIIKSRVCSTQILTEICFKNKINHFINLSAIGFYDGKDTGLKNEESDSGKGFLSFVCKSLENKTKKHKIKFTIFRLPIVFAKKAIIWQKFNQAAKFGFFFIPVQNKYRVSWVHVNDVARAVDFAITKKLYGTYNLCTDNSYTWEKCYKVYSEFLNKKLIKIVVPLFVLRIFFGERHHIFTDIQNTSNSRLINSKFKFKYVSLRNVFKSLKYKI